MAESESAQRRPWIIRWFKIWTVRVVLIYVALFGLSVLVLLGFVYVTTVGFIDRQVNATIDAELSGLRERYAEQGLPGLLEVIGERIANDRTGETIYLLTDGEYNQVAGNIQTWPTDVERQGRWASFVIERAPEEAGLNGDVRAMSFLLDEGYHLMVGRFIRERQNFDNLILQSIIWSLLITGGLGALGGFIMSIDMRRRLDRINRTTQRIMQGDLQQRVPVSGSGDEFDRLSRNLNAMLAQIDRLMLAMREVTDNVAHDLRSPLTRLKSRLEVTLLSQKTTEEYRRALEQSVVETDKILSTFNALLSIAQAEAGSVGDNSDVVEVDSLIADIVELYEPVAEARDIEMTIKLGKAGTIKGDRHLLFQAAANLVDNAVKYSPDGGKVQVETRRAANPAWVEIIVGDSGLGIPEADRPRVVERFVRLEQSRTTPGNGLGLSLVSAVMHRHGGELILEDNEPGLRAILRLRAG